MINPVNNNIPNEYSPQTNRAAKVDNNEHFSLESALSDSERGVIYEPSSEKEASTKNAQSQASKQKDSFVSSLDAAMANQKPLSDPVIDPGTEALYKFWDKLSLFFSSLLKNVKQFFENIWDSKPLNEGLEPVSVNKSEGNTQNDITSAAGDSDSNATGDTLLYNTKGANSDNGANYSAADIDSIERIRDNNIRQALADGDKDKFRALVTNGGKNMPARSTTMITTYDKTGKVVNLDPSDENKILHGDRGVTKL